MEWWGWLIVAIVVIALVVFLVGRSRRSSSAPAAPERAATEGSAIPDGPRTVAITDGRDFAEHGSRCMWVYVIDMDAGELIVHAGDMSTPVVASWPLTGLPSAEEFQWAAVRDPSIPL